MKSNFIAESSIAGILIILLIFILNPFHMWMPTMMLVSLILGILVAFIVFASFILRERVSDEREASHRSLAGRAAFMSGSIVLIMGILIQSFSHSVDIWLVLALVVMVLAKLFTRMYSDRNL